MLRFVIRGAGLCGNQNFTARSAIDATPWLISTQVLGDRGVHARSAVGTNALPLGVPVEIEAIVEVKEGS